MIRIFISLLTVTLAGTLVQAAETNAPAPVRIGTDEADKHMDESVVVTGMVAQVSIRPKIVFLNLDKAYPDAPFSAVIMTKDTNSFGDLKALEGKAVEVSGKVKSFKDKPEIVIESTNQLLVLGTTNAAEAAKK